jgi:hypothetical protein
VLYEIGLPSGVNGVPMSFQVDGKQYVAVQSAWAADAARLQLRLNLVRRGQYPEVPQGGSIWVLRSIRPGRRCCPSRRAAAACRMDCISTRHRAWLVRCIGHAAPR